MDWLEHGRGIVEALRSADYAKVSDTAAAEVKDQLTAEVVEQIWTQVTGQVGGLKEVGEAAHAEADGYQIVDVPMQFENMALVAKIAFNDDAKIVGLNFVPG